MNLNLSSEVNSLTKTSKLVNKYPFTKKHPNPVKALFCEMR